jgi:outer membrane protein assembly factor BamB
MKRRELLGTAAVLSTATAGCLRLTDSGGAAPATGTDSTGTERSDDDADVSTAPPSTDAGSDGQDDAVSDAPGGRLLAFDRDGGDSRWQFETPNDGQHRHTDFIATTADTVFVGTDDDGSGDEQDPLVFALDAETGESRYRIDDLPATFIKGLFVRDGTLYVATVGGTLFAYAAADGTRETTFSIPFGFGPPTVVDGEVYVPGEETVALNLSSGSARWRTTLPSNAVAPPVVTDDTVYAATRAGHVVALARDSGDTRWQKRAATQVETIAAGPTALWASDGGGTVYAYARSDGTELYRQRSNEGDDRSLAVVDDLLFLGRPTVEINRIEGRSGDSMELTEVWSSDDTISEVWPREGAFYGGFSEIRGYGPDGPLDPVFGPVPDDYWAQSFGLSDSLALVGTRADD